jgi:hypothetical protein
MADPPIIDANGNYLPEEFVASSIFCNSRASRAFPARWPQHPRNRPVRLLPLQ